MKKLALTFLLTAALLTACGKSGGSADHSGSMNSTSHGDTSGMEHGGGQMNMEPVADKAKADSVKATITLSSDKPEAQQSLTITVHIQDKDGKAIEKFDVENEKQMHMIIVSKDLSFFNHIHPDYMGNGDFVIHTEFPTAGQFEIISDFAPAGMGSMNKSQWVTIQGTAPSPQPIVPDAKLTKEVFGKEVTLSFDHLAANQELKMNFNLKDAQTKEPITDLQPYLGAVGHVVILNQEGGEYLHVHPTQNNASGPDAKFAVTFPHSGIFKIWGQFQQNGVVYTVPFVVKVP